MPLKLLFIVTYVVKLPLPILAALLGGWPAFAVAAAIDAFAAAVAAGPADTAQLARLDGPPRRELRLENPEGEESIVIPLDEAMNLLVTEAAEAR